MGTLVSVTTHSSPVKGLLRMLLIKPVFLQFTFNRTAPPQQDEMHYLLLWVYTWFVFCVSFLVEEVREGGGEKSRREERSSKLSASSFAKVKKSHPPREYSAYVVIYLNNHSTTTTIMKIFDVFYSVVAAVVAAILFAQSVAGDESFKSKAAKGGPAGADLAGWLRQSILATVLVGQVFEMASVVPGLGIEREEFQQILGSDFDGSAVWDIDIFSAVNVNEDDTIEEEELVTHLQAHFLWAFAGKEGSKAGKGGIIDPESLFWSGLLLQRLVNQVYHDTATTYGEIINKQAFITAAGLYDMDDVRAGVLYGRIAEVSSAGEYIDFIGLKNHVKKHVGGEMFGSGEGEGTLDIEKSIGPLCWGKL